MRGERVFMPVSGEELGEIQDIEKTGRRLKWQYFEKFAGMVFGRNGYDVSVSVVRKNSNKKRQYDVIAEGPRHVIVADCKRWTGNRYRKSQLKRAVESHIERCVFLKEISKQKDPGVEAGKIIPVIITLVKEDIRIHGGVPVVPFGSLNSFINDFENYDIGIMNI